MSPLRERLNHLPRETRDTLFLLAVIAWVLLPQAGTIPLWCSALSALVLIWRGALAWRGRPLPGRWWLLAVLGATLVATWWTHRTLLGRDAGVTLIVVLLALKTLELRARRDAFVVFFLGFFVLLTNFLQSQSLVVAGAMLVGVLGLLTGLVNAHMPVGKPPLLQAARTALWMAAAGAPVMAALFVLFPRVGPLWGMPGDTSGGRTGLSGTLRMGAVATLALDESIVLRIRFDGEPPPAHQMYFRGPVLGGFDGTEWRAIAPWQFNASNLPADVEVLGEPVRYTLTQEPSQRPWLLLLETPAQAPHVAGHEVARSRDLQWLTQQPLTELIRTQVVSYPLFRHGPRNVVPGLGGFMDLPPGSNPRTVAWAAQLKADPSHRSADGAHWIDVAMNHLRQGGYQYTLDPGVFGPHAVDEFWFDRKEGFCEHMAASFVVLMRALGVPARIVTGYQGGERNPLDEYWVVRQSDAHAWAEVWLAGQGWVRVDPTAAVAPGRVGALQRLVAPRGVVATALGTLSPDLLLRLRSAWDAVNNRWNQWILGYSQTRQFDLLRNLGFSSPSWTELGYVTAGLILLALLVAGGYTVWDRRQRDPWLRQLERARGALLRAGLPLAAHLPPRHIAREALVRFGPSAQALHDWLLALEQLRYGPAATTRSDLHQLARRLQACTATLRHHNTA